MAARRHGRLPSVVVLVVGLSVAYFVLHSVVLPPQKAHPTSKRANRHHPRAPRTHSPLPLPEEGNGEDAGRPPHQPVRACVTVEEEEGIFLGKPEGSLVAVQGVGRLRCGDTCAAEADVVVVGRAEGCKDIVSLHMETVLPYVDTLLRVGSAHRVAAHIAEGCPKVGILLSILGKVFRGGVHSNRDVVCAPRVVRVKQRSVEEYGKAAMHLKQLMRNNEPHNWGRVLWVREPGAPYQAWDNTLQDEVQSHFEITNATTPEAVLEGMTRHSIAIGVHSPLLALAMYLPLDGIVVEIAPRGMEYEHQLRLERLYVLAGLRIVNHRAIEDTVKMRGSPWEPHGKFSLARDEIPKLVIELLVLLHSNESDHPVVLPASQDGAGRMVHAEGAVTGGRTEVEWYTPKSKFDPDHLAFGPVGLDGRGLVIYSDVLEYLGSNITLGKYTENDRHYYPVPYTFAGTALDPSACRGMVNETVYFHYPWVRDNIYHSHNDNFWPLFLTFLTRGDTPRRRDRAIVFLHTRRSNKPVSAYAEVAKLLFSWVGTFDDLVKEHTNSLLCFRRAIWGRPPRLFANKWGDVEPYLRHSILPLWRRMVYLWYRLPVQPLVRPVRNVPVVTWVDRKKPKRVLTNEGELFAAFKHRDITLAHCCEGMSFAEQVAAMHSTDVLVGTHGAGLFHVVFLHRGSYLLHLAPRRLNYHEQTIIERMAFAAGVRYLNTRTATPAGQPGEWNSPYYSLPKREIESAVSEILLLYRTRTQLHTS